MTSRRQLAAEVMLAHRLKNLIRINDTTEIDTCYISCAEYQLFIDEMLKQGKYHQLDHWLSTRFPRGCGAKPVAGMRPSDAKAFCDWLTARDNNYRYRLPFPEEVEQNPVQPSTQPGLTDVLFSSQVGTWCQVNPPTALGGGAKIELDSRFIESTFVRVLARALARDRALDRAHDRDLERARARALVHDHDFQFDIDRTLDRAIALIYGFDLDLDHVLDLARGFEPKRVFQIAFVGGPLDSDFLLSYRYITYDYYRDNATTIKHAFGIAFDRTRASPLNSVISDVTLDWIKIFLSFSETREQCRNKQALDDTWNDLLHILVSLAILEERLAGRLPAWEGIRIVRERIA